MGKERLTKIRKDHFGAKPGKFRVVMLDSAEQMFQIGEDTDTLGEARAFCREQPIRNTTLIYDDQGVPQKK